MNNNEKTEAHHLEVSPLKGLLLSAAIMVIAIVYIVICEKAGFHDFWVGLTALVIWVALGRTVESIPKVWIGAAVGILMATSLWWLPEKLGMVPGYLSVLVIITLALWALVIRKFDLVINDSTFLFFNVFQAHAFATGQIAYLPDLAFMAVLLGVIPFAIIKYLTYKKTKQAQEAVS